MWRVTDPSVDESSADQPAKKERKGWNSDNQPQQLIPLPTP